MAELREPQCGWSGGSPMDIGEQRRTIYVEPIEEDPGAPRVAPLREEPVTPVEPQRLPEPAPNR